MTPCRIRSMQSPFFLSKSPVHDTMTVFDNVKAARAMNPLDWGTVVWWPLESAFRIRECNARPL